MSEITTVNRRAYIIALATDARDGKRLGEFKTTVRAAGFEGRAGGYIYAPGAGSPICQGWRKLADRVTQDHSLVTQLA
jgi:hypothetical protein